MICCWLPAETLYVLFQFGIRTIDRTSHLRGAILAFFNSCLNPLIYWMTNREYRAGLFEIFKCAKIEHFRKRSFQLDNEIYSLNVLPGRVEDAQPRGILLKSFK